MGTQMSEATQGTDHQGWPVPEQPQPEPFIRPENSVDAVKEKVVGLIGLAREKVAYRNDCLAELGELAGRHPEIVRGVVDELKTGETE